MATFPEPRYDPEVLATEVGKLFGLELKPNMITRDGVNFESGAGNSGVLKVELMKVVSIAEITKAFNKARAAVEERATLQERNVEQLLTGL